MEFRNSRNPFKHWNSDHIIANIAILAISFCALQFWYYSKHWNSVLIIPNSGILTLFFQTLEFWPYPSKYWNSDDLLSNIEILTLFFQTLEFLPYLSKSWNSDLITLNSGNSPFLNSKHNLGILLNGLAPIGLSHHLPQNYFAAHAALLNFKPSLLHKNQNPHLHHHANK